MIEKYVLKDGWKYNHYKYKKNRLYYIAQNYSSPKDSRLLKF